MQPDSNPNQIALSTKKHGDGQRWRTVNLDDLFEGGSRRLARSLAADELMESTGLGRTACYEALKKTGISPATLSSRTDCSNSTLERRPSAKSLGFWRTDKRPRTVRGF